MAWENGAAIAQIVSAIAVLVTLVYLAIQAKQTNNALLAASRQGTIAADVEVLSASFSSLDVRPYPKIDDGKWQVSSGGGEEPHWSRDGHTLFFLGPKSIMATTVSASSAFGFETPKAMLDRGKYVIANAPRVRLGVL